eukprot:21494-Heterococcus_DN1.PRE.2
MKYFYAIQVLLPLKVKLQPLFTRTEPIFLFSRKLSTILLKRQAFQPPHLGAVLSHLVRDRGTPADAAPRA